MKLRMSAVKAAAFSLASRTGPSGMRYGVDSYAPAGSGDLDVDVGSLVGVYDCGAGVRVVIGQTGICVEHGVGRSVVAYDAIERIDSPDKRTAREVVVHTSQRSVALPVRGARDALAMFTFLFRLLAP